MEEIWAGRQGGDGHAYPACAGIANLKYRTQRCRQPGACQSESEEAVVVAGNLLGPSPTTQMPTHEQTNECPFMAWPNWVAPLP